MRRIFSICVLLLVCASCQNARIYGSRPSSADSIIRPVVAVSSFENRSGFEGKWNLGEGMADILVTELLESGRVTVLERKYIDDVLGGLIRQGKAFFRKEGKVTSGRLKNARYLIRGVVTDFTVTRDASGWFGTDSAGGGFRSSKARVALNVYITDVESGEIFSSVLTEGKASSGLFRGSAEYNRLAFGGEAYFRTPLGKATQKAIKKALKELLSDIPIRRWEARVAEGGEDQVMINGGQNVGLNEGDLFIVRKPGRPVTDPITGNIIDRAPGIVVGKIKLVRVSPLASQAAVLEGRANRGDFLEAGGP